MKKALFILIALALLAVSVPMFAEAPAVKGAFIWFANWDPSMKPNTAGAVQARVILDTKVDDFNQVYVQLRGEGTMSGTNDFFAKQFKVVSNVGAALGLPIGVKLTAGLFDDYATNWWYADSTGWCFYYGGAQYNWPNHIPWAAQNYNGALALDLAIMEGVGVHVYSDIMLNNQMLGVSAAFGDFGLYLGYGNTVAGKIGEGDLNLEFKYALPEMGGFKATLYPYFRYGVGATTTVYSYGLSVGGSFSMFGINLALQGDQKNALSSYCAEFSVAPMAGTKVWVNAYMGAWAPTSPLVGIDIGASQKIGAANIVLGYMVGGADKLTWPIYNDAGGVVEGFANGVYLGVDCAW